MPFLWACLWASLCLKAMAFREEELVGVPLVEEVVGALLVEEVVEAPLVEEVVGALLVEEVVGAPLVGVAGEGVLAFTGEG